ncbi:MAG: phosphopantetheine-binding protein [Anaeromyxobacter sp.]
MNREGPPLAELSALLCETLRIVPPNPPLEADELLFGGRLPLDSVDSLQWAAAVERRYRIELSDTEIGDGVLLTLGRVARAVAARVAEV